MARAGRKRKQGRRYPSGQLVRVPKIDRGTPEIQRRREVFAGVDGDPQQTIDALGRAMCAGLVTPDQCEAGRQFSMLYWCKLPAPNPISSLYKNFVSGLVEELPSGIDREAMIESADERDSRQEHVLNAMLVRLNAAGHDVRRAFDQLVIDPFPDFGPAWLDRLIRRKRAALVWNRQHRKLGYEANDNEWWLAPVDGDLRDFNAWQHALTGLNVMMGRRDRVAQSSVRQNRRQPEPSILDPAFFDDRGYMLLADELAAVLRDRAALAAAIGC